MKMALRCLHILSGTQLKKKSLHYLAFALRVIIPRQHHHLRNLSSVVSFEQCISVIHYKSTSLWWYITQKMGTSGKNESGNRFSVIGFIWGYKPGYCYLKRCSAWPRATSTAKARKPLADTTKPKPTRFFPFLPVRTMISLLLTKGWGWHCELQRSPTCAWGQGHGRWGTRKIHAKGRSQPTGGSYLSP